MVLDEIWAESLVRASKLILELNSWAIYWSSHKPSSWRSMATNRGSFSSLLRTKTCQTCCEIYRVLFDPVTVAGSTIYVVDRRTKPWAIVSFRSRSDAERTSPERSSSWRKKRCGYSLTVFEMSWKFPRYRYYCVNNTAEHDVVLTTRFRPLTSVFDLTS